MKKKIVYIAPHLSTGGMPQYLVKQIESIKDDMDVYCIEWGNVTGGVLVIQRNKMVNLLGTKLITLDEDKHKLFDVLETIKPDIIHLQEIPEYFMPTDIADKLYSADRPYVLIETSHDSGYNVNNKTYLPDKFLMVSKFQTNSYETLGIPTDVVEYPIENKVRTKTREQALRDLGLDPSLKHVINVGLFTPRKNQAEIIEYARMLQNYPIQFHFIGNHADNFKFYWEPLMKDFPPNCKWWNERSDVDAFYEAADLFLFTSRGHATDMETMPLVIREALSWKVPSLIYNLPVYLGYFDKCDTIKYLHNNADNSQLILEQLGLKAQSKECIVVTAYPNSSRLVDMTKNTLLELKRYNLPIILASNYPLTSELTSLVDYHIIGEKNILDFNGTKVSSFWARYADLEVDAELSKDNVSPYTGPAAHTVLYDGIEFAKTLGFDVAHTFSFDMKIYDTWFDKMRKELQTYGMVIHKTNYEHGESDVIRPECVSVRTDFFLENFPKISSIEEYYAWMDKLNSDTNTLEKLWYLQIQEKSNEVYYIDDDELGTIIDRSDERGKYRGGFIFEALPIKNDTENMLLVFHTANPPATEFEHVRIFVNDSLYATVTDGMWYDTHQIRTAHKVRCELYDVKNSKVITSKERIIDDKYFEQPNIKDSQVRVKGKFAKETDFQFDVEYVKGENKLFINYKKEASLYTKISIRDKDSHAPIYWIDATFSNYSSYWVMPIPTHAFDFDNNPAFSGFLVEFYDINNELKLSKEVFVKEAAQKPTVKLNLKNPFDCLFINYAEMFVDKKYDCYGLNNLDVVLDIGANSGLFSILMANNGCKKIYAFEPNTDSLVNLRHISKNIDAIIPVEKAVYSEDKDLEFFIDPNNTTIGSISETHLLDGGFTAQKITVPAISLKTFIQENNLDKISLVKMDIEGAEYQIMERLEDEVYEKVDSFLIEYHDNHDKRIVKMIDTLKSKGYDITQIRNQNSKDNESIIYSYETSVIGTLLAKKSPKQKLLTVIVPSYNHEKYIEDCVDSILKQKTLFNFNILISDDCSTDSTFDIIQKYKDIPNVIIQRTKQNEGATTNRLSNLITQVKSDYITILDADDYYTDEFKLQKQIEFLENNPEYSIHSTGWVVEAKDSLSYTELNLDGISDQNMCSRKSEVSLQDNCVNVNYIGFGFMFKNKFIIDKPLPSWFFEESVFDGYWAIVNLLLEYGRAKNEDWVGGRYRITPSGQFGAKNNEWKEEKINKQLALFKQLRGAAPNPIIIVDAFFHDEHCLTTFKEYLASVKELNLPIMLVTNSTFDQSLINEVDYIVYDSNNRLFEKQYKDIDNIALYWMSDSHYISTGTPARQRHGLSVLSNLYHSTNLAKSLGYTHFYRIEYDAKIGNVSPIKDIITTVSDSKKKGLVYINVDRYVSFQVWYFELEYFTKYFPKINNENDYILSKEKFNYEKDFMIAEEFIYNMVKYSEGGFSNVIAKTAQDLHADYGHSTWNTITSPTESEKIINGCVSTVCRVANINDAVRSMWHLPRPDWQITPEMCEVNTSKVAIVTWNCSSNAKNQSLFKLTYPDGKTKTVNHMVSGMGDVRLHLVDIVDGDINIEILLNNESKTSFVINKDSIKHLTDVYQSITPV